MNASDTRPLPHGRGSVKNDAVRMKSLIQKVSAGKDLSQQEAESAFDRVMRGEMEPADLGALVCALAAKGEAVDELVGAARALRRAATRVHCDRPCMDTCGTGGDGISTFNVSTVAAIIAAAAGAVVAKHGNRTSSRVSGSSEVLESLGVNLEADVTILERSLRELGIAFLHAPHLHPAMKYAAPVRRAIRVRTIFNLVGPLANPAGATRQLLGVSRPAHVELMAAALKELGAERAWVVHGADGLCDLSITGASQVAVVRPSGITRIAVSPEDVGLKRAPLESLMVSSPAQSAEMVRDILSGKPGPPRDHALLNAAAALVVYGTADDLPDGLTRAADAIDSGAAKDLLDRVAQVSHS